MPDTQDMHDLRGEISGIRSDIRAMRDEMKTGFADTNGRVRKVEDALIETKTREAARAEFMASGNVQMVQLPRPPIMKDTRTYAVGGVGTAIAMIVFEFLKTWGSR